MFDFHLFWSIDDCELWFIFKFLLIIIYSCLQFMGWRLQTKRVATPSSKKQDKKYTSKAARRINLMISKNISKPSSLIHKKSFTEGHSSKKLLLIPLQVSIHLDCTPKLCLPRQPRTWDKKKSSISISVFTVTITSSLQEWPSIPISKIYLHPTQMLDHLQQDLYLIWDSKVDKSIPCLLFMLD